MYNNKIKMSNISSLRTPNRNVAAELSDKAKILNNQFKLAFTAEASNITPDMGMSSHVSMDEIKITKQA